MASIKTRRVLSFIENELQIVRQANISSPHPNGVDDSVGDGVPSSYYYCFFPSLSFVFYRSRLACLYIYIYRPTFISSFIRPKGQRYCTSNQRRRLFLFFQHSLAHFFFPTLNLIPTCVVYILLYTGVGLGEKKMRGSLHSVSQVYNTFHDSLSYIILL